MDGGSLVDLATGYRWKTLNACGSSGPETWSACVYLSSVRSLFGLGIAKIALDLSAQTERRRARGTSIEVRVHVECRECRGRQSYSEGGLPEWMPLWFVRNLARATRAGISTIWRLEQRSDDEGTKRAFGAWAKNNINWLKEASQLTDGGSNTLEKLTNRLLRDLKTQQST
jgi:hypothetical protein